MPSSAARWKAAHARGSKGEMTRSSICTCCVRTFCTLEHVPPLFTCFQEACLSVAGAAALSALLVLGPVQPSSAAEIGALQQQQQQQQQQQGQVNMNAM